MSLTAVKKRGAPIAGWLGDRPAVPEVDDGSAWRDFRAPAADVFRRELHGRAQRADRDARYRERIVAQSLAHLPVVHPRELLPGSAAFHGRPPIVEVNEMPCPNCGAPVDADTGTRCPVCNAPLADA